MRGLSYRPVVDSKGDYLPWVCALKNLSGAYVIRSKSGRILYVGESHTGRLKSTLCRHFSEWRDSPERKHHVYNRRAVEVAVRITPPPSAVGAQNNLIMRLEPRDNGTNPKENNPF